MPGAGDHISVTLHLHPLLGRYLSHLAGKDRVTLLLEPGTTVDTMLYEECGLPRNVQVLVIKNGRPVKPTYEARDGDVLNVFLPFGGG